MKMISPIIVATGVGLFAFSNGGLWALVLAGGSFFIGMGQGMFMAMQVGR